MKNLNGMTVKELKVLAKKQGLTGYSKLIKSDLVAKLELHYKNASENIVKFYKLQLETIKNNDQIKVLHIEAKERLNDLIDRARKRKDKLKVSQLMKQLNIIICLFRSYKLKLQTI